MTAFPSTYSSRTFKIGEVYLMRFDGSAHVQKGWRPGIVFQNDIGNLHSPNIIALPLTTSLKKMNMPTHVLVKAEETGLKYDSMVLAENPRCLSKEEVGAYITTLPASVMRDVALAHLKATSALSYLQLHELLDVWQQTINMNSKVS